MRACSRSGTQLAPLPLTNVCLCIPQPWQHAQSEGRLTLFTRINRMVLECVVDAPSVGGFSDCDRQCRALPLLAFARLIHVLHEGYSHVYRALLGCDERRSGEATETHSMEMKTCRIEISDEQCVYMCESTSACQAGSADKVKFTARPKRPTCTARKACSLSCNLQVQLIGTYDHTHLFKACKSAHEATRGQEPLTGARHDQHLPSTATC